MSWETLGVLASTSIHHWKPASRSWVVSDVTWVEILAVKCRVNLTHNGMSVGDNRIPASVAKEFMPCPYQVSSRCGPHMVALLSPQHTMQNPTGGISGLRYGLDMEPRNKSIVRWWFWNIITWVTGNGVSIEVVDKSIPNFYQYFMRRYGSHWVSLLPPQNTIIIWCPQVWSQIWLLWTWHIITWATGKRVSDESVVKSLSYPFQDFKRCGPQWMALLTP
jgi:hypothetical protein